MSKSIKYHVPFVGISFIENRPALAIAANIGLSAGAVAFAYLAWYIFTGWVGPGLPTYITFYPVIMMVFLFAGYSPVIVAQYHHVTYVTWRNMASNPGDKSPGYNRTPLTGLKNLDAKT